MPGFMSGIHVLFASLKTWMAGTSPAMTIMAMLLWAYAALRLAKNSLMRSSAFKIFSVELA